MVRLDAGRARRLIDSVSIERRHDARL